MQIVLRRRPTCWTAELRGFPKIPAGHHVEVPLPYTPDATADFVYAEVGRAYPQARLFHVINTRCEGCTQ